MTLAIITNDKIVLALAVGIPAVAAILLAVWSRPRRMAALWTLVSLALVAAAGVGAWAAITEEPPSTRPVAIGTIPQPSVSSTPSPPPSPTTPAPSPTPSPTAQPAACQPDGTELHLVAHLVKFDTDCLAAPADTAFTIVFDNQDVGGIPHNVHIFSADPSTDPNAESLFNGDLVPGPDILTYEVSPLPAGTYFFQCDVHPVQMIGTFVSG